MESNGSTSSFQQWQVEPWPEEEKKGESTKYIPLAGTYPQVEIAPQGVMMQELMDEGKSIFLILLKQVKIGMDLSRIALPTFILEPKSTLEKLGDYLSHGNLLAQVPKFEQPLDRFIHFLQWYLSAFYIKPKGVKKPWNPVIGEIFRCMFQMPNNDSQIFYVAEQVSHHPPVTAFYASNRKDGFVVQGSVCFRSKFLGTSVGSVLEGTATVTLLDKQEEYEINFPSAFCKGFMIGPLIMEYAGTMNVVCKQTGYSAKIEFKQKGVLGGEYNVITGKIMDPHSNVLYYLQGKWDGEIIVSKSSSFSNAKVLWDSESHKTKRLQKMKPDPEDLKPFESDRLWHKMALALDKGDYQLATTEKTEVEDEQRKFAKIREKEGISWVPRLFEHHSDGSWRYKWANTKPWNPTNESKEIEQDGVIQSVPPVELMQ